jgi:hypothetical protein
MEKKNVPIRVPVDLHLAASKRMLAEQGEINFQRFVVRALEAFVADEASLPSSEGSVKTTGTAKEQKHVSEFLEFLRTGEKSDVHTVLSLIARLSAHRSEMGESLPERKLHSR